MSSQQFEINYNKLRAIIQAHLNTNKTWIVNDFRETDPMDVDYTSKSKGNGKGKSKGKSKNRNQGKGKSKNNSKGKGSGKPDNIKECYACGKRSHFARDCWSRANNDKMVNEVEVENTSAEPGKEYVYTIEHEVNVVNLSQTGCGVNKIEERKTAREWDPRTHEQTAREWDPRTHESLVMIDSGAPVNVYPKWFGNSRLEQSDGATCLRGAKGKPLQEYRKRQIGLKICGQTKRYDFHLVDVTKPILSVSCLCENGVEARVARESFLRFGDGHEPLIRKGVVYFVKAQTVNACVRADGCTEKPREYNLIGDQKTREYKVKGAQKKIDAHKLMDSQKIDEYEMTGA